MNKLALSLATLRYDHVADLITGHVTAEGITLNYLELSYHEILLRGVLFHDFDVAEISMAKYASMRSSGDDSLIAIPVFPNRMVRHTSIYVLEGGPIKTPADLAGRRIGLPEWAQTAAQRYVRETGIYPVMHTIVIRKDLLDRAPWVAANLYAAFEEAKRNSLERAFFAGASMFPIAWHAEYARHTKQIIGDDIFPYGVEANRVTLEAFLDYAYEQGVCSRRLAIDELFAPQTLVHAHV